MLEEHRIESLLFVLRDASYDAPQDGRKDAFTPEHGRGIGERSRVL